MVTDERRASYDEYLSQKGLKSTHQRDLIVGEFLKKHQHLTVEELWERVKQLDSKIGYATVYRTLRLLTECGLASKRKFVEGHALFEQVTDHHHDHLICLRCKEIVEFENDSIENLQARVCHSHKFKMVRHKLEIYGYCRKCSKKGTNVG